ncbi:MAG: hypothetical protein ACFB9M_17620 [Myxococcota bacterium]
MTSVLTVVTCALLGQAQGLAPGSEFELKIEGNRRFSAPVLRRLARVPEVATYPEALRASIRLQRVLKDVGFILAITDVFPRDEHLVLWVDEGSVERIVFPGQSPLSAATAQLLFELKNNVFNQVEFEEQIEELEATMGNDVVGYELVRRSPKNPFFQLDDIGAIADTVDLREGRYILAVKLAQRFEPPGWALDLYATGPDGLVSGVLYRWANVFTPDDRLSVLGNVGIRFDQVFSTDSGIPVFSRGGGRFRWFSSPVLGSMRLVGAAGASYLNRQRLDLSTETFTASFDLLEPFGEVGVLFERAGRGRLSMTFGADFRELLEEDLPDDGPQPTTDGILRGFAELRGDLQLFPSRQRYRVDQRLQVSTRIRTIITARPYVELSLNAERAFPLWAYSELKIRLQSEILGGEFGLLDEIRISDVFRGLFGDTRFTSAVGVLTTELFISLQREYLRLSVFADGLVASDSRFVESERDVRVGGSFGVGIHALFLETIQGSIYGVFGGLQDESFDGTLNLSLSRLF